jgi:hypothetical protein
MSVFSICLYFVTRIRPHSRADTRIWGHHVRRVINPRANWVRYAEIVLASEMRGDWLARSCARPLRRLQESTGLTQANGAPGRSAPNDQERWPPAAMTKPTHKKSRRQYDLQRTSSAHRTLIGQPNAPSLNQYQLFGATYPAHIGTGKGPSKGT